MRRSTGTGADVVVVVGALVRPGAAGPVSSSEGRTPVASLTSEPEATTTATAPTTPTTVWARRRAAPERRTIVARGQRPRPVTEAPSSSSTRRSCDGCRSRATDIDAAAVCSSCSARSSGTPTSRAIWSIETDASWVSTSTRRCVAESPPRASRVARTSGVMSFSRCQTRAVCLRCASRHACGRTWSSGRSSRLSLRQWCQAATKASCTARRDAPRSPVSA